MGKSKKKKARAEDTDAILERFNQNARACAGKSILELMEDRLDEYIDEMMDEEVVANMKGKELERLKGTADGLAQAISIVKAPHLPDPDEIKNEAMVRYEERNA